LHPLVLSTEWLLQYIDISYGFSFGLWCLTRIMSSSQLFPNSSLLFRQCMMHEIFLIYYLQHFCDSECVDCNLKRCVCETTERLTERSTERSMERATESERLERNWQYHNQYMLRLVVIILFVVSMLINISKIIDISFF